MDNCKLSILKEKKTSSPHFCFGKHTTNSQPNLSILVRQCTRCRLMRDIRVCLIALLFNGKCQNFMFFMFTSIWLHNISMELTSIKCTLFSVDTTTTSFLRKKIRPTLEKSGSSGNCFMMIILKMNHNVPFLCQ